MNNTAIKNIINNANTNKTIKWSVESNTATKITLTNSYDKAVHFTIKFVDDDEFNESWISVHDDLRGCEVGCFLQGTDKYSDYTDRDDGIKLAVEKAVRSFNYWY